MKLMKHITIALVLCAIPAMAFGQTADCESCEHQLPIYVGAAGFVATVDGDAEMVNWRSTCGNVTTTGMLMPNDEGVVAALLDDRGLNVACSDEDGMFELGPIMDGGWFWMHMGDNSAVGNIVAMDILENAKTDITDSGNVTMTMGAGAVLLVDNDGNFGILPNILPMAEMDPVPTTYCGYSGDGNSASPYMRVASSCMLGDGSSTIRAQGEEDPFSSERPPIMDGAMVTRPAATDSTVEIIYDLWIDPGSHVTDASATGNGIVLGQGGTMGDPLSATFTAAAMSGGPTAITDISTAGLAIATATNVGTLTISPNTTYCSATNNHPVTVTVTADATTPTEVTPNVKENAAGNAAATHKITVVCAAGAGSQVGVELVPENPFPVN